MPIDPEREELLTLTEATKALPKMRGPGAAGGGPWRGRHVQRHGRG